MSAPARMVVLIVCVACSVDGPETVVTVRDSAGVRVVESIRRQWDGASPWSIGVTPRLDIGTTGGGGAAELYRVTDATMLSGGRIAIANDGSDEVRLFDGQGAHLASFGREGEGPGEFRRMRSVSAYRGDSLLVYDYWLGRATVLTPELALGRVFHPDRPEVRVERVELFADGSLVGSAFARDQLDAELGLRRIPMNAVRFGAEGGVLDSLGRYPGYESFWFESGDARPVWGKSGYLAVHDDAVYVGTADSLEYQVWDSGGGLRRIVRVPGFDLTLTPAEISREREALIPPNAPQRFLDVSARLPDPQGRPAYSALIVDSSGHVWLEEARSFADRNEPATWEVFAPDGSWLGRMGTPARFRVYEIGEDYILGRWRDGNDVEHVQVLTLTR